MSLRDVPAWQMQAYRKQMTRVGEWIATLTPTEATFLAACSSHGWGTRVWGEDVTSVAQLQFSTMIHCETTRQLCMHALIGTELLPSVGDHLGVDQALLDGFNELLANISQLITHAPVAEADQ